MPDRTQPDIAVVVPTFRRPQGLHRLIDALAAQTLDPDRWEAVIVDDGSGPAAADAIRSVAAGAPFNVRLLHHEVNQGPAAARNLGWRSTTAPIVAFTDDDCLPHASWLESGLSAVAGAASVGIVQGRTVRAGGEDYPYTGLTVIREVSRPSPWFEGCNLFLRRQALEGAGGFDESLGYFGEETSLGWQVVEAGWDRAWADDAVVEHELMERPWRWHVRFHYLEGNIVRLAGRHPGMRVMFWRPWAVKKENALFALALLGLVASSRRRSALLLTVPYLRWLPRPWQIPLTGLLQQAGLHAVSFSGKAMVSVRERTFLL